MDVSTLKGYISKKQVPSFLIFSGTEWAIQKIYINKVAEVMDLNIKYIDSISDIYGSLRIKQLSFAKAGLYIVRDDKEITTNEKVQSQLNGDLLKNNILVLLLTNVDKRTKFYKQYKDDIIDFEPLKPTVLKKYIQKEINLSDINCEKLMDICEYDYGRCLLEIDKIRRYKEYYYNHLSHEPVTDDFSFKELLREGIIYQPPKDAIFELIDAILDRKTNQSFELLRQSYAVGEATMVMLSVLYNNTKALLQVQSCQGSDIAKITGLNGFQIMNAKKHLNVYRTGELVNLLKLVRKCEKGIKTGQIEEQYVMDYILVSIL